MTVLRRVTVALFVLVVTAASAQASIITLNYDFSATGFDPASAPVDLESGSDNVSVDPATDDFLLQINNVSTSPTLFYFVYAQKAAGPGGFFTFEGTLTPREVSPVPEPASLTLLGVGFAWIGVRQWRQRKAS